MLTSRLERISYPTMFRGSTASRHRYDLESSSSSHHHSSPTKMSISYLAATPDRVFESEYPILCVILQNQNHIIAFLRHRQRQRQSTLYPYTARSRLAVVIAIANPIGSRSVVPYYTICMKRQDVPSLHSHSPAIRGILHPHIHFRPVPSQCSEILLLSIISLISLSNNPPNVTPSLL